MKKEIDGLIELKINKLTKKTTKISKVSSFSFIIMSTLKFCGVQVLQ